ncbi:MAG: hypothetical protein A2287_04510 [Candidatus Melainabacteria bacterium RIFOXYA12_FULL_32_12]|nr:MAG: hypothetical protein A2104_07750 [Candidatus Melainabacteria bacterium GWF2_32_7]OGI17607.1 MAG: hypothetical protein A2255_08515 [Candidatus Melainabacteria bacterium RIFOXYA2_FULL_32_9]OGI29695.1 MAG: hypothetical protein A2287_04510 [Candidatus Melainabacteria bacterium RIFOXYA12_FULL_32_12]
MNQEANNGISLSNNKLNSNVYDTYTKDLLFKFVRSYGSSSNRLKEIASINSIDIEKDIYGNIKYDFLSIKSDKTQSRVNILRFFKPGEILNFILTH